ncbi:hypothetical protein HDU79_005492 [Rhizoclosmatium sp. JEL0117]|nr:hypothetical protein HDU79_005492 [Rhizoclosmatium sp. JEL0117]
MVMSEAVENVLFVAIPHFAAVVVVTLVLVVQLTLETVVYAIQEVMKDREKRHLTELVELDMLIDVWIEELMDDFVETAIVVVLKSGMMKRRVAAKSNLVLDEVGMVEGVIEAKLMQMLLEVADGVKEERMYLVVVA